MEKARREIKEREDRKALTAARRGKGQTGSLRCRGGCQVGDSGAVAASADDLVDGGVFKPGGAGREDCTGPEEQEGSWDEVW